YRGDDAAGLVVARRLRDLGVEALEQEGDPVALLEVFARRAAVVLVDAVQSGAPPGTVHRVDVSAAALPRALRGSTSAHAVGRGEAIDLARTRGLLPQHVVVYGVEGARFDSGAELSDEACAAVGRLVDE